MAGPVQLLVNGNPRMLIVADSIMVMLLRRWCCSGAVAGLVIQVMLCGSWLDSQQGRWWNLNSINKIWN